jgi:hypothetical protein
LNPNGLPSLNSIAPCPAKAGIITDGLLHHPLARMMTTVATIWLPPTEVASSGKKQISVQPLC